MSNETTVEFLFDFGSPNAYLCHRVIPDIEARTGTKFTYVPILLGGVFKATGNQSPMTAFAHIQNKMDYDAHEITRFLKRYDITDYGMNPHFPINTLVLMRGAVAAQRLGVFDKYVDEIYRYMWSDHRKMDDIDVVMKSLIESGLPAQQIAELIQDPSVKQELVDNTTSAVDRKVFGSPSFFVNGELYFGKDRLWEVEEAINIANMAQKSRSHA